MGQSQKRISKSEWSFQAQITGSVRISAEGDIFPKISIPFEEKEKLPDFLSLSGEMVEMTINLR